jgi:quercetin dioxygenase-like cupin family protein
MLFTDLDQIESRELQPGFHGKVIHMEGMTYVHWRIEAGASLPAHSHHHEQLTHVLQGEFELTIGEKTQVMKAGDLATIPGHAQHRGRALTECLLIDVFQPVREAFK